MEAMFLLLCEADDVFGGEIGREAEAFLHLHKRGDREFAAILSTARTRA